MAVTLNRCMELLAGPAGIYYSGSLTSIGAADGTTVVDTGVVKYDTNTLKNKWVYLTSGTYSGQSRRISTVSSSTVTVTSAFGGQVASGVTYYIFEQDPDVYIRALGRATRTLYPLLYLAVTDITLVTDNLLGSNSSFETFSTTFTGWTNIGTPTLVQSGRNVHGSYSASIGATGAVEGIERDIAGSLETIDCIGKTLHVRGWTWDDAASSSRIRVTFDGSTYTNGTYNTGDAEWNYETGLNVAIPADYTEATISCEVATGEAGLFDLVVAWVDKVAEYTVPSAFADQAVHFLEYQVYADKPEGLYLPYCDGVPSGRALRLRGKSYLTVPSSSASVELTEAQAELLIAQANAYVSETLMRLDAGNRDEHRESTGSWQAQANEMKRNPGSRMPGLSADERIWWSIPPGTTMLRLLDR